MSELLRELISRLKGEQVSRPAIEAPAMFQAQEPDLDFKPHPFFSQLNIPKPWQRGGNRSSEEVERARWIPKDAMLRPEDAGDYSLQDFDRSTQIFSQPQDVRQFLMKVYNQGLSRIRSDRTAGRDPYNQEQPVGGGKY